MGGGQFFCFDEGKGPHEGKGYCRHYYFSFDVVEVHDLSGVIVYTKQDEKESNSIFLLGAGITD